MGFSSCREEHLIDDRIVLLPTSRFEAPAHFGDHSHVPNRWRDITIAEVQRRSPTKLANQGLALDVGTLRLSRLPPDHAQKCRRMRPSRQTWLTAGDCIFGVLFLASLWGCAQTGRLLVAIPYGHGRATAIVAGLHRPSAGARTPRHRHDGRSLQPQRHETLRGDQADGRNAASPARHNPDLELIENAFACAKSLHAPSVPFGPMSDASSISSLRTDTLAESKPQVHEQRQLENALSARLGSWHAPVQN